MDARQSNRVTAMNVGLTGDDGVIQKVTFLGNTDNVNFGRFAYDSTDGHPKKCYPILNHAQNSTRQ